MHERRSGKAVRHLPGYRGSAARRCKRTGALLLVRVVGDLFSESYMGQQAQVMVPRSVLSLDQGRGGDEGGGRTSWAAHLVRP